MPPPALDADRLHNDALVWDMHTCMPLRPGEDTYLPKIAEAQAAGTDVAVINIGFGNHSLDQHHQVLNHFRGWFLPRGDEFLLAANVADARAAKAQGKMAIFFNVEGAKVVEDDLTLIEGFYKLGVRWMLCAYNRNNKIGGGCHDDDTGLTARGREWVREMERVGMLVCCSHTGYRTARDILEYAEGPVILSHSNPRAMKAHPRNVPDDIIQGVAVTGGVIGINGIGVFLGENDISTDTLVRHIDYAVDLVGAEHVGIGLDYVYDQTELDEFIEERLTFPDGYGYDPGMKYVPPRQLPEVTKRLVDLGYPESAIRGILGENWARVMEMVG